jgi:hypothetical protein
MASKIIIRRTTVSGRTPNTVDPTNTQFINTGELALNLTDKKLFSSNGTLSFEIGSNLTSLVVSNTIFLGNSTVNTTVNSSSIYIANSTANTLIKPGNAALFGSVIQVGNSTVNSVITSSAIAVNGDYVATNNYVQNTFITNVTAYSVFALAANVTNSVDAVISNTLNVANSLFVNTTAISISNNIALYANGEFGGSGTFLSSNGSGVYWAAAVTPSDLSVNSISITGGRLAVGNSLVNVEISNNSIKIGNSTSNIVINSTMIIANGSAGGNGNYLTSNGTSIYWTSSVTPTNLTVDNVEVSNGHVSVGNSTVNTIVSNTGLIVGNSTVNSTVNSTSFSGTSNNALYLGGNSVSTILTYANNKAANAYSNATSYADYAAENAYSNAVSYTDIVVSSNATTTYSNSVAYTDIAVANAYSNAVTYTNNKAGNAYSNAVTYAGNAAANAYSNAVSYADLAATNAYSNAVSYASNVAGNAYSNSVTYTNNRAANAYSNAVTYASLAAANAYTNAVSYADSAAATAYSNAVTYSSSYADSHSATAYANAVYNAGLYAANAYSNAIAYAGLAAANAYSNAISYAGSAATSNAAAAYANAVTYTNTYFAHLSGATFTGNVVISNTGLIANGSIGTNKQVLLSNGSSPYWAALAPVRQNYTANGTGTTYTVSGGYTPYNLDVYVNGVKLLNGIDVDVSNGSIFTTTSTYPSGTTIDVLGQVPYTGAPGSYVSKAGDTMSGTLTVGTTQIGSSFINVNSVASGLIPSTNLAFSLGNTTNRWNDLYVGSNSIIFTDSSGGPDQYLKLANQVFSIIQAGTSNSYNANAGFNAGGILLQNFTITLSNTAHDFQIGVDADTANVVIHRPLLIGNSTVNTSINGISVSTNTAKVNYISANGTTGVVGQVLLSGDGSSNVYWGGVKSNTVIIANTTYTATANDKWMGFTANVSTLTLPNTLNGATDGKEYQVACMGGGSKSNVIIQVETGSTLYANGAQSVPNITLGRFIYISGVWYGTIG